MSRLMETQRALAKLLTDSSLLEEYLAKRSSTKSHPGVNHALDVNDEVVNKIASIELRRSAETLLRKRKSQTRSLLPFTATALGREYGRLFRTFSVGHHFNGLDAIDRDALTFSEWISDGNQVEPWKSELARWEALPIRWRSSVYRIKLERFHYNFDNWISQGASVEKPPVRTIGFVFSWRFKNLGKPRLPFFAFS